VFVWLVMAGELREGPVKGQPGRQQLQCDHVCTEQLHLNCSAVHRNTDSMGSSDGHNCLLLPLLLLL
jgi:hypothetical protein